MDILAFGSELVEALREARLVKEVERRVVKIEDLSDLERNDTG